MAVRLYHDIDGCLNAGYNARVWRDKDNLDDHNAGYMRGYAHAQHDDHGVKMHEFYTPQKYRMEWNERLIAELNTLDVEFVWATTWREDARNVGRLMGLTHHSRVLHPVAGITTFPSIDWKYEAIRLEQELDPSPFIWVDDELASIPPTAIHHMEKTLGGLLIAPEPNLGVTPADIQKMREYIAQS